MRARQICDGTFGLGGGIQEAQAPKDEPVAKVGVYKDIEDEDKRRSLNGEPPLAIAEIDIMMRNWFRVQRGEAPLPVHPMTRAPTTGPRYGKGGFPRESLKGKGKGKW